MADSGGMLQGDSGAMPAAMEIEQQPAHLQTTMFDPQPNPFNPATTIWFELATAERTRIVIYNIRGVRVRDLMPNRLLAAGRHSVNWDGTDTTGTLVASGVYYARMTAGDFEKTARLVLVK